MNVRSQQPIIIPRPVEPRCNVWIWEALDQHWHLLSPEALSYRKAVELAAEVSRQRETCLRLDPANFEHEFDTVLLLPENQQPWPVYEFMPEEFWDCRGGEE